MAMTEAPDLLLLQTLSEETLGYALGFLLWIINISTKKEIMPASILSER